MDFYVCILSFSYCSDQETEHIEHLRKLPHAHSLSKLLSFLDPSFLQGNHHSYCYNLQFISVCSLTKCNQRICTVLGLGFISSILCLRYIHEVTCSCTVSIIVFHCMNILQFNYPVFLLMDFQAVSSFWLLGTKLLEYFCACLFVDILPEVKFLDRRVDV